MRTRIDAERLARARAQLAAGVNAADICRSWGMSRNALSKAFKREAREAKHATDNAMAPRPDNGNYPRPSDKADRIADQR